MSAPQESLPTGRLLATAARPVTVATDPVSNLKLGPGEVQFDGLGRAYVGWTNVTEVRVSSLPVP